MRYLASPAQLRWQVVRWSLLTVPLILALGFFSASASGSGPVSPWFAALAKPALFPPPIAFPIVWSAL
ncbi:tryptophan-rich sensory protein, partial [Acinetobacter baumannii]